MAPGGTFPEKVDGFDIWEALTNPSAPSPRDGLPHNINRSATQAEAGAPKAGLRVGTWKVLCYCYMVKGIDGASKTGPFLPRNATDWPFKGASALFNLATDPGETRDLSEQHPDQLANLLQRLAEYAAEMVIPMQWTKPYQGPDYGCADCPLRPATGLPRRGQAGWSKRSVHKARSANVQTY